MRNWKLIAGVLLGVVTASTVVSSTMGSPRVVPPSPDAVLSATVTFVSVVILHWLLWRFIVPSQSNAPSELTTFFAIRLEWGFFSAISFGYMLVALYCFTLSGYSSLSTYPIDPSKLLSGLFFIALGTAVRLRKVVSVLCALYKEPDRNV